MKKIYLTISMVSVLFYCIVSLTACQVSRHEKPNPSEMLKKTWQLQGNAFVRKDGIDQTNEYADFSITFKSDGTYTSSGGKKLFHPGGTWLWPDADASQFTLYQNNGDLTITVAEITGSVLHIWFTMDVDDVNANGRSSAVVGNYELLLNGN